MKFAEDDFQVKVDSGNGNESESEIEEELITESKENAVREEEKRMDAEMDRTTEMFRDYLKTCDNSNMALEEIDQVLDKFSGDPGNYSSLITVRLWRGLTLMNWQPDLKYTK